MKERSPIIAHTMWPKARPAPSAGPFDHHAHPRRSLAKSILLALLYCTLFTTSLLVLETYRSFLHDGGPIQPADNANTVLRDTRYDTAAKWDPNARINVHLVSHTHDDVGWLTTIDGYYSGTGMGGVQYIIDGVVRALLENPARKFTYVEMSFFWRWWRQQSPAMRRAVRNLVDRGQLAFVNGGWSMNDEAAVHYASTIDQMTLGHRFLLDEFGYKPRIGWHVDPFGHSNTQAALFAMMDFDAFVLGRIDRADRDKRRAEKTLEFLWKPSPSLGNKANILGAAMFEHYCTPHGFEFENFNDPIEDDRRLHTYNVESRIDEFLKTVERYAVAMATNNVLIPMGCDFTFFNAAIMYKNIDKLIHYLNRDGRVNAFYSTPEMYIDSLHKSGIKVTVNTADLFPYSDGKHAYWTGYFTSRPAFKRMERVGMGHFQACRQVEAMTPSRKHSSFLLAEAMGNAQHHDGVSGTEQQAVAEDYARRLSEGMLECDKVMAHAFSHWTGERFGLVTCHNANISLCGATEDTDEFEVIVYNPLATSLPGGQPCRHGNVAYPVKSGAWVVLDEDSMPVPSSVLPLSDPTLNLRADRGPATYSLVFTACVPPLGIAKYRARQGASPGPDSSESKSTSTSTSTPAAVHEGVQVHESGEAITLDNGVVAVRVAKATGRIDWIRSHADDMEMAVAQEFMYYESSNGTDEDSQSSGAYIFRPASQTPSLINPNGIVKVEAVGREIRSQISAGVSMVIRLDTKGCLDAIEVEKTVGPIPVQDGIGKEVIVRYSTDIESAGIMYTDSNGREMQKRIRNYRATWELEDTEPVSQNYYPVNTRMYIRDEPESASPRRKFAVLVDRSVGAASLKDGQVEVMLHRRLLYDDARGVVEPINEPGYDEFAPGWRQTTDCLGLRGRRDPENDAPIDALIGPERSGYCQCNSTLRIPFDCDHAPLRCSDVCPEPESCMWRQTSRCKAKGPRLPAADKNCSEVIIGGWSGYCECGDGVWVDWDCGHPEGTCKHACLVAMATKGPQSKAGLVVRTTHRLLFGEVRRLVAAERRLALELAFPLLPFVVVNKTEARDGVPHAAGRSVAPRIRPLPPNVHLLTMERLGKRSVLLRLEHFYEKGEDEALSVPACVDLASLFEPRAFGFIKHVEELSLSANSPRHSARRLEWEVLTGSPTTDQSADQDRLDSSTQPLHGEACGHDGTHTVVLRHMDIRTFRVTF